MSNTKSLLAMTKKTTNLVGIIITILAGTYFFISYCSECGMTAEEVSGIERVIPESTDTLN